MWALIRNEKPPMIPEVKDPYDTSNFEDILESDDEEDQVTVVDLSKIDPFTDFEYQCDGDKHHYGDDSFANSPDRRKSVIIQPTQNI
jgi:hypothetical protein